MRRTALRRQGPQGRARAARLRALRPFILRRADGRCEVPWCEARGVDLHHLVKRAQTCEDRADWITLLCRPCHQATDLASGTGRRLRILPSPGEALLTHPEGLAAHPPPAVWKNGFVFWRT